MQIYFSAKEIKYKCLCKTCGRVDGVLWAFAVFNKVFRVIYL